MERENESWLLRPDTALKTVLDCIPGKGAIGYFEIRDRTRIAGEQLDGSLETLEGMGILGSNQTANEVVYWRIAQLPRRGWYTIDEAADHMAVSKRTVQHLIRDGQLTAYRVGRGGHRRIKLEDLDSAMHRDQGVDKAAMTATDDPVLAELWDNEQDSVYDQL